MSKLLDRLNTTPPDNSKANRAGKDKTPIDDQKFPFPGSKDYVKDEAKLKSSRGGELGSFPGAPSGYTPPGYGPGQSAYSVKVPRR
jgi:hypothetical protein